MKNYEKIKNLSVFEMATFIEKSASSYFINLFGEFVTSDWEAIYEWLNLDFDDKSISKPACNHKEPKSIWVGALDDNGNIDEITILVPKKESEEK